jgi:uncharacterized RDD family membrane protein YckC
VPVTLRCPRCGELRFVADDSVEETVPCSGCGVMLKVPRRAVAPTPVSAAEVRVQESPYRAPLVESANPFADRAPQPKRIIETENPYQAPALAAADDHARSRQPFIGRIDPRLASRWKRFLGSFLDSFLIVVPFIGLTILAETGAGEDVAVVIGLVASGIVLLVDTVLISTRGQSLGKMLLGMQIVRVDYDAPPGFVYGILMRSWVPALIGSVPFVGSFFQLADALFIFGDEKQCLHDKIAGTKVLDRQLMEIYARRAAESSDKRSALPWDQW